MTARICVAATCIVMVLAPLATRAKADDGLALKVAEKVLAPSIDKLDAAFKVQAAAWALDCSDTAKLRTAYSQAADAWAGVEHARFGPLSKHNRAERIAFWPDPRNATGRGLDALINSSDEAALTSERLSKASVAIQGLPVIERLLYPAKEPGDTSAPQIDTRRCAIGRAVSQNLAHLAAETASEWRDPERGEIARMRRDAAMPELSRADASLVLSDLATLFQIIEDRKLPPLTGMGAKPAPARAAESWRSGRSRRNLSLNLKAVEKTLAVLRDAAPDIVDSAISKLQEARRDLESSERGSVGFSVVAALNNLRYDITERLPRALGIPLGFNSLDGD